MAPLKDVNLHSRSKYKQGPEGSEYFVGKNEKIQYTQDCKRVARATPPDATGPVVFGESNI